MTTEQIIDLLIEERGRLESAIEALQGAVQRRDLPTKPTGVHPKPESRVRADVLRRHVVKRTMSAAARKRISDATKARWAALRAEKGPKAALNKKSAKAAIAEAVAGTPEDASFKAKMSAVMKKAWAKRKKAVKVVKK